MTRALRLALPLLALACACDAGRPGAPPESFPTPYTLALTGPTAPFREPLATLTATPDPPDGTLEVRFAVDGVVRTVDLTAPYTATLDLLHEWGGPRLVTATAHRADGAVATATLTLDYDPLGPFVTVLSPAAGTRVAPEGGSVDVSFLASDPYGLAAGAVQIGDAAEAPIPLPALALTLPVPATTAELPAQGTLRYWLDDATGNRTEGTIPLVQTHERFALGISGGGTVRALPGGRVAVIGATGDLRVVEADGTVAWSQSFPGQPIVGVDAAAGGDLFVKRASSVFSGTLAAVDRLHADSTLVWSWPSSDFLASDAVYAPAADGLLAVRRTDDLKSLLVVLVDAGGVETHLMGAELDQTVEIAATAAGVSPSGLAATVSTWTTDPPPPRLSVFDAAGAPAWSLDLPASFDMGAILTRDAVVIRLPMSGAYWRSLVGSGGLMMDLGPTEPFVVAPNGDALVTALAPAGPQTVSRVTPSGAVAWQVTLDEWLVDVVAAGDRVALTTAAHAYVVDAAGGVLPWIPDAKGGLYVPQLPRVVLAPTGPFYVFDQGSFTAMRVHHVATSGETLWHETLAGQSGQGLLTDQGELVLIAVTTEVAVHAFAP